MALESTLFAHGLPRPVNLDVAHDLEAILRQAGVVPATVGVVDGVPTVGLGDGEIELLATRDVGKASLRDLPLAAALGAHAATTVSATAWLAHRAGVQVFATGGLGGVHRGASTTFDESADLFALAQTPIVVVCAGVKSVLDVPATLERLESLAVGVAGYRTERFPGFLVADSGYPVPWTLRDPEEVARAASVRDELGQRGALVIAVPVPEAGQLDPELHRRLLAEALDAADAAGVAGQAVTPFLLDHMQRASAGASLAANLAAVRHNARVAAAIAVALSEASGRRQ